MAGAAGTGAAGTGAAGTGFGAECFPCVLMLFLEAGRLRLTSSLMKVLDGA
ncbi:uncharacterized protein H6S33_004247 [Morchella sextelata]|uniref:uncharacterized protein n=1 Tax=Morchella sextelata TaxID=1174677 RepID=UPI001D059A3D|nr:uncharacterized protein H6S33_004247 [Morchella sextelata]KAH0605790.1 hypothetical protein H6S33_004247 [Morchella sextelata]